MASAFSLVFLLLLLVAPPFSSAAFRFRPSSKTSKYIAQVRSIINKTAKDYQKDKVKDGVQDGVQDIAGGSNNVDGRDLGSSAAASYGALTFDLSVGNPPQSLSVVMDITSGVVWAQCDDPCFGCVRQTPPRTPTFLSDISASFAKIRCNDPSCQRFIPDVCSASDDLCGYTEFFHSGKTSGYLANENFSFGTTVFPAMLFGCGGEIILPELGGASGFAGFSRGPLSLVSQLQISQFSYLIALPDDSGNSKSSLSWSWDDAAPAPKGSGSTPLLAPTAKQNRYWYYVRLTGIEVDGQLLTAIPTGTFDVGADGSGGVFLSTTLPVTYLEEAAYSVLRSELVSRIKAQGVDPTNAADDLYHLCYGTEDFVNAKVPTLALVFDGSDTVMELSVENYFFRLADGQTCLTILPPNGGSVLGSLLQLNTTMTYHIYADGTGMLTFETAAAATAAGASPTTKAHGPLVVMIISTLLAAWGLSL